MVIWNWAAQGLETSVYKLLSPQWVFDMLQSQASPNKALLCQVILTWLQNALESLSSPAVSEAPAWTVCGLERTVFLLVFRMQGWGWRGMETNPSWNHRAEVGTNICSKANLPVRTQNSASSGQQDSFTGSLWKLCCLPSLWRAQTQSVLAYFVSKQLSDSISTNKKGYNYTLIL